MKRVSLPKKLPFSPSSQWLLGLAPLLLVAGIAAGVVTDTWNWLPMTLLALAGLCLLAWLVMEARVSGGFWGRRSTQVGTNALLSLVAVLVLLGVVNFLGDRYMVEFDLTENQNFTLAAETQEVITSLEEPVNILVFSANPNPSDRLLLEQYRRQSEGQVNFEFVDPQARPGLAQKYNIQRAGDVILEAGNTSRPLEGDLSETNLTPGILRVTSDRRTRAYFTTGHGEIPLTGEGSSLSEVAQALEQRAVEVEPLNLLETGNIPEDANVVIVAGPRQPFLELEENILEDYLKRGGSVLLMLDVDGNPGLTSLLSNWGLTLDSRWVIDGSGIGQQVGLGPDTVIVTQYGNHPITGKFAQGPSLFPRVQAVVVEPVDQDEVVDLVITGEQTWAEAEWQSGDLTFDEGVDTPGPLTLGVAISRPLAVPENGETLDKESRLVVFGDSEFASDRVLAYQGVNSDLFINSVLWLGDRDDQVLTVRARESPNRRLQMNVATSRWISVISLLILPLIGFGLAVVVWWKRR
ncbi:Gldg family protein [Candidatus Synechococcus calcipolaris G9]|uniref:Gldg family protein n=1 Tax=Candidatus Synechococcus calcipolaris G9 TaxID=1497997 RepID=A0ABT6EZS1_9SYNE|nr:Gldg family protein [Candidatus Synechococcus calcipolaris]MDG2991077.1 Gldg family protein [Candidatus Synechococcus calcipolaris G9]